MSFLQSFLRLKSLDQIYHNLSKIDNLLINELIQFSNQQMSYSGKIVQKNIYKNDNYILNYLQLPPLQKFTLSYNSLFICTHGSFFILKYDNNNKRQHNHVIVNNKDMYLLNNNKMKNILCSNKYFKNNGFLIKKININNNTDFYDNIINKPGNFDTPW